MLKTCAGNLTWKEFVGNIKLTSDPKSKLKSSAPTNAILESTCHDNLGLLRPVSNIAVSGYVQATLAEALQMKVKTCDCKSKV